MKSPHTIVIASDHAGFDLKSSLINELEKIGFTVQDLGTHDKNTPSDYPDYGTKVAQEVAHDSTKYGIIICGSGIGISIAANRNPKARAALCLTPEMAKMARAHNNANILALAARLTDTYTAITCLHAFLKTPFEGGRHNARVEKLSYPNI